VGHRDRTTVAVDYDLDATPLGGRRQRVASTGYASHNPDQLMIWFAAVASLKPRSTGLGRLIRAPPE
jgi:hypothetical protein